MRQSSNLVQHALVMEFLANLWHPVRCRKTASDYRNSSPRLLGISHFPSMRRVIPQELSADPIWRFLDRVCRYLTPRVLLSFLVPGLALFGSLPPYRWPIYPSAQLAARSRQPCNPGGVQPVRNRVESISFVLSCPQYFK